MRLEVVLHPLAREDLKTASAWYELQVNGLGIRFAEAVSQQSKRLEKTPKRCRVVHGEIRRCSIPKFPYELYFQIIENVVLIVAVFAVRKDPNTLIKRFDEL